MTVKSSPGTGSSEGWELEVWARCISRSIRGCRGGRAEAAATDVRPRRLPAALQREADLASTLWHPHIVGVHDRGEADGQLWISMDFVDGVDAARLAHRALSRRHAARRRRPVVTAVGPALDYAHKQGLLHRDVKPANIMLTHVDDEVNSESCSPTSVSPATLDDISGLTTTDMTIGTVAYWAPDN